MSYENDEMAQYTSLAQIVAWCLWQFVVRGFRLSAEFDVGGARHGQLPGLRPGWLFGRSMVRLRLQVMHAWQMHGLASMVVGKAIV